jgi:profilin
LETTEAQTIANCFKTRDFGQMQANGIRVGGNKYQFLREDDGKVVYGRCKGNGGIAMQKSKTAIIIGHYAEGSQGGQLNKGVSQIADYLESAGY